jgi:NitT/TauT family transport system permease protein
VSTTTTTTTTTPTDAPATMEPEPVRRRNRISRLEVLHRSASLALLIVFLGLWQFASGRLIAPVWISSPALVWQRLVRSAGDGSLVRHVYATFEETILGLAIGVVLGVVVGIVLANTKGFARIIDPYLVGAYSLPRVALAPFFVLWFGIGLQSKALLVVSIAFFPVLFNVRQGMSSIDSDLMDVYRSMRAGRWPMLRDVVVPSVMPWIVSSIKIAIGMALIGAVVGEMVGADRGLGWLVTQSINNFDMTGAMMSLLLMAVIATVLTSLVSLAERWMFRWQSESGRSSIVPM